MNFLFKLVILGRITIQNHTTGFGVIFIFQCVNLIPTTLPWLPSTADNFSWFYAIITNTTLCFLLLCDAILCHIVSFCISQTICNVLMFQYKFLMFIHIFYYFCNICLPCKERISYENCFPLR